VRSNETAARVVPVASLELTSSVGPVGRHPVASEWNTWEIPTIAVGDGRALTVGVLVAPGITFARPALAVADAAVTEGTDEAGAVEHATTNIAMRMARRRTASGYVGTRDGSKGRARDRSRALRLSWESVIRRTAVRGPG
jgi:hypothetical protein